MNGSFASVSHAGITISLSNSMNVGGLHSDSKSGTLHLHIDCCRVDGDGKTNDVHDIHLRAMKNASVFKASEIGRRFMVSKLEATWQKLHPRPTVVRAKPVFPLDASSETRTVRPVASSTHTATQSVAHGYLLQSEQTKQQKPLSTLFSIDTGRERKSVSIPNNVKDIFTKEAEVPADNDVASVMDVAHVAMLLFVGYLDAAASMSASCGGGGGSSPESGWGKKYDEDDRKFAHRCVQMAHSMCKPKPRQRRRGFHR